MDESLFKVTRNHRRRLCISFDDAVRPRAIAAFLRDECGAKQVGFLEDPLGDFYDIDYRIGLSTVCLASDNWMLMLVSESLWSDFTIWRIARRLRKWRPPADAESPP